MAEAVEVFRYQEMESAITLHSGEMRVEPILSGLDAVRCGEW